MHVPVLLNEVLEYLDPKPNENFIDATIGGGGHSVVILEMNGPNGRILGIEKDPEVYKKIRDQKPGLRSRLILVNDSFTNLENIVAKHNFRPVQGILFDLGMSSWHLEESGRGFSFKRDEMLDMRYNPLDQKLLAKDILNHWPTSKIEKILKEYGEEKFARKIAKSITEERKRKKINTTNDLVDIILKSRVGETSRKNFQKKIHPATRVFQALRIVVNNELENIEIALPQTINILAPKGRLVVISFHSLEDRIVKNFLKEKAKAGFLQILTKKPIRPTENEARSNPRSRSAKLRAAIKI